MEFFDWLRFHDGQIRLDRQRFKIVPLTKISLRTKHLCHQEKRTAEASISQHAGYVLNIAVVQALARRRKRRGGARAKEAAMRAAPFYLDDIPPPLDPSWGLTPVWRQNKAHADPDLTSGI